jgi:hypothetical protein
MMLWTVLADELGEQCGVSTAADVSAVSSRIKSQGWSYMTISLPQFCKDFERSLADEQVSSTSFVGFRRKGGTPIFLGGFLDLIFDRGTGILLPEPSIDSIHAVRQLTLLFAKMELRTSAKREAAAMRGFVEVETDVQEKSLFLQEEELESRRVFGDSRDSLLSHFRRMSNLLWGEVFAELGSILYREQHGGINPTAADPSLVLRPRHGPGATADKLFGNEKFDLSEWPRRLDDVFPYGEYAVPNARYIEDRYREVTLVEPEDERPVRVVAVPKTMKTPRIIAIEPTAMQYMQQGLSRVLVRLIERDSRVLAGALCGFADQMPNRVMAREGSLTGALATLDLSEASDRVSHLLVQNLVHRWPLVKEAIEVTRSTRADVQGIGVIPLSKYASMGSALTFPVEAMCFLTLVFLGIEWEQGSRLTRDRIISDFLGRVRVYGDDIIVPVEFAPSVIRTLEAFGLKVNRSKSFWTGKFRESCGKEYYDGHDVSVVKVRKVVCSENGRLSFPTSLKHVPEVESYVSLRNRFYAAGLWRTASYLDEKLVPLLKGYFPNVEVQEATPEEEMLSRSRLLGRWSFLGYQSEWTHPTLHNPLVKGWVVSNRIPKSEISGVGALQKVLSKVSDEPFADRQHLERAGRPEAVYMKLRRVRPF